MDHELATWLAVSCVFACLFFVTHRLIFELLEEWKRDRKFRRDRIERRDQRLDDIGEKDATWPDEDDE